MNLPFKDGGNERKREEALARRMGQALDRLASRDAADCPDAEVLAAYHDQALEPDEVLRREEHFAGCARCRKILAVLAASDDTPLAETEVARLGELIAAAQAPRAAESLRPASPVPIRSAWKTRCLASALGIAAVLAIWFAVKPPWRSQHGTATTLIAQAPGSEPPLAAPSAADRELSKALPEKQAKRDAAGRKDQPAEGNDVPNSDAERLSKNPAENGTVAKTVVPAAGLDELKSDRESKSKRESSSAPAPAPPAPTLQAEASNEAVPMNAPRTPAPAGVMNQPESGNPSRDASEAGAAKAQKFGANLPGRLSSAPLNSRSYSASAPAAASLETGALVRAPGSSIAWRVGKAGSIERSEDGGRTWAAQESPLQDDWTAGAAASDKICWIVGRNGAIARTTDGEHWLKLSPPPSAADTGGKFPDWINITASDEQLATITAADRRRFTTRDGGKTWRAQ